MVSLGNTANNYVDYTKVQKAREFSELMPNRYGNDGKFVINFAFFN